MHSQGYTNPFGRIVGSSVWQAAPATRLVWIAMIALADRRGFIDASEIGIASLAKVSIEDCRKGIKYLEAPDPYSEDQSHEGRRIEKCERGWRILNPRGLRADAKRDERREYFRNRKRETRHDSTPT